jgi:hypothetical protein
LILPRKNTADISIRTCVISSLRLTVVLSHGSRDFTWYYVPLGVYSVFEPLGGIICTNLPIIWHMMRKRKALLPTSNPALSSGNTPTIGSGSLRSRVARSLGLGSLDYTQDGSCNLTIIGSSQQEETGMQKTADMEANEQKLDPDVWTTVKRIDTANSSLEAESFREALEPGMRKTVWNVRK